MAVGPYKPIYLEIFDNRIDSVSADVEVAPGLDSAILTVNAVTTDSQGEDVEIHVLDPSQGKVASIIAKPGTSRKLVLKQPQLWYPVGYGKQPLYTVKAKLVSGRGNTVSHRIGVRLLEVVQRPLQPREVPSSDGIVELVQPKGLSFFFRVNHIPIYSQGTNWIAPDTFLPRMTKERYRESLIDNLLGSNQNMIRVWGGGQFESIEDFYDVCDEQGILVWQDMMMGCGSYPVNDDLLANIENEVTQNVKRLSTHPCMALWAGNNEVRSFLVLQRVNTEFP
jgi:beta-mannosidase